MFTEPYDYSLYLKFFDTFSKSGLEGIDDSDPLMMELDHLLKVNKQLFYFSDVILLDVLFISKSAKTIFGIEPDKVNQGFFLTTTHPEDLHRHQLARAKVVSVGHDFYAQKHGTKILSINVRARKPDGSYFYALYQAYLFYSTLPYESVFLILVITDISEFPQIHKKFHFYSGDDFRFFRLPDHDLLLSGNIFSQTEFRIIELIDEGLSSGEIADKLFRSVYTINTHRTNIIRKSGKKSMTDVIRDLKEQGLL